MRPSFNLVNNETQTSLFAKFMRSGCGQHGTREFLTFYFQSIIEQTGL